MAVRVRQARNPLESLDGPSCRRLRPRRRGLGGLRVRRRPPDGAPVVTTTTTDTTTATTTDTTTATTTGTGGVKAGPSAEPPGSRTSLALEHPGDAYPVVWVRKGQEVEIRTEPGGGEVVETVGKRTEFGSPTVFGVEHRRRWAGVTTP